MGRSHLLGKREYRISQNIKHGLFISISFKIIYDVLWHLNFDGRRRKYLRLGKDTIPIINP